MSVAAVFSLASFSFSFISHHRLIEKVNRTFHGNGKRTFHVKLFTSFVVDEGKSEKDWEPTATVAIDIHLITS